jgi:dimethylargininase
VSSVAEALARLRPKLERIAAPGTLDGGDVCQVEEHFLIGVSARTNPSGAQQLADILRRHGYSASLLDIRSHPTLLHLKSGISYLGERRFTVSADAPALDGLEGFERVEVAKDEAYAANCVRVNDTVLIAAGYPRLAERLDGLGYALRTLEVSEFRKMDGGLSCLSIRL